MKLLNTLIVLVLVGLAAFGQNSKPEISKFDVADFGKKFEVVQWLVEYDNIAWKTTDFVMELPKAELAGLGREWFCFQDKNKVWHAVYGGLNQGKYETAVHLEMDASQKISKSSQKLDQDFLNSHALALKTGLDKLQATIPAGSPRFNQFIRENSDKSFSVWLLPAFQPNRMAVYGGEAIYTIDQTGTKILKDESYFQKGFRGFMSEPPREIWLNYSELEKPSLGAIFFVWYYKSYFTKIFIENSTSTSTALNTKDGYMWVHVDKNDPSKAAEKNEPTKTLPQIKKPGGN